MELFESALEHTEQPLAYRMRPRTLDEFVGQDHIVGKGRLLRRAIQADQLSSVIFYGPPGSGKTTLARVIANTTKSHFSTLNAVLSGVKELRYEIDEARNRLAHYNKKTILFIDEVHRWNKSQQDALLPWVENGTVILIGATTENPYFEVNSALVSRSRIFQLLPLNASDLTTIAQRTLDDKERGYGKWKVTFEPGALEHLVAIANGDARSLLNALELAVETTQDSFPPPEGTSISISRQAAEESIQRKVVLYDKEGDYHFDIISAFIKSIRGSDPDAALYWMARMVYAGEDPKFIFRRMLISACEDIGMADPQAIAVVNADAQAFERIGLPEGRFHLAHAALYLATAPKSNTTMGFFDALKTVEEEREEPVPTHLKDASRDSKSFGHGKGYLYPHAYEDHWVLQQYLPPPLQGKMFYRPSHIGYEAKIHDEVIRRREAQLEGTVSDSSSEILTYYGGDKERDRWIQRTLSERSTILERIRDTIFSSVPIARHDRVLVVHDGYGLLTWEAFRRTAEGLTMVFTEKEEHAAYLEHYARTLEGADRPRIMAGDTIRLLDSLEEDLRFEAIIGRNIIAQLPLQQADLLLRRLASHLTPHGTLANAQHIPLAGSRLSDFLPKGELRLLFEEAEQFMTAAMAVRTKEDALTLFESAGFQVISQIIEGTESRYIYAGQLDRWLTETYLPAWQALSKSIDGQKVSKSLHALLDDRQLAWRQCVMVMLCSIPR